MSKNKNKTFKITNIKDYFGLYLQIMNAFVDEEYKLTFKEREFLVLCIMYKYQGGNLSNFTAMHDFIVENKFCKGRQDVSTYKQKLSIKKWVKTGKYSFILAPSVDFEPGAPLKAVFNISYEPVNILK
jgi:hypothetical protein